MPSRKTYTPSFKTLAATEAIKATRPLREIALTLGISTRLLLRWKKQALARLSDIFNRTRDPQPALRRKVERLVAERDWLKERLVQTSRARRAAIDAAHPTLSVTRQCALASVPRSTWNYARKGESKINRELMRLIKKQHTMTPYYGSRRMTVWLVQNGHAVNRKRVQRLMGRLGVKGVRPKPEKYCDTRENRVFPYLLRNLAVTRPGQVWSTDITYLRLRDSFAYLTAFVDSYSRYVVAWEVACVMNVALCLTALKRALRSGRPEIINTDQGSQYTSQAFIEAVHNAGIKLSVGKRGWPFDNIFIERLWRTVKYEEVYLQSYETIHDARRSLSRYFRFYNIQRPHQALRYRTPEAVHVESPASA